MTEKDYTFIAEKVASKVSEKDSALVEKLKSDVLEVKTKLAEAETCSWRSKKPVSLLRTKQLRIYTKQIPSGGLLKNQQKMMLVSEHLVDLEDLRVLNAPVYIEHVAVDSCGGKSYQMHL